MLKHIVCWKLKDQASGAGKKENIKKMKGLLEGLPGQIPEIVELEVGINFNNSDTAFDISLYSVFRDAEGLDTYQVHPAHQEVAAFIKEVTQNRVVVDYYLAE